MKTIAFLILSFFISCSLFTDETTSNNTIQLSLNEVQYTLKSSNGFFLSYDEQNNVTYQINFRDEENDKYATLQLPISASKGSVFSNGDVIENKGFYFTFFTDDEKAHETTHSNLFTLEIEEWDNSGRAKLKFNGTLQQKYSSELVLITVQNGKISSKVTNEINGY